MASVLNEVIIYPLYALLEAAFVLANSAFNDCGMAIVGLSITVSLLTLPLYIVAERWSEVERSTQKSLAGAIKRIKTTFKGDEQYMMLSTLYREHHYHPLMALRSSIGLLIQIPFFIAAYSFLSHLSLLQECGLPLLGIRDLAAPDAMISLHGVKVNVLPVAMTVINIAAGAIYTKGLALKDKLPIYGMAILFLVILYTSPSGLVLYWTMNNVFSLVKNVFYKIKRPLTVAYVILCAAVAAVVYRVLFLHNGFLYRRVMFSVAFSLLLTAPLCVKAYLAALRGPLSPLAEDKRGRTGLFLLSALSLAILCGAAGPSLLIGSSAVEFCGIDDVGPLYFVVHALLQSAGLFVLWPLCVYSLFGKRIQTLIAIGVLAALLAVLVDTFMFPSNAGNISRLMTFDAPVPSPSLPAALLNIFAIAAVICVAVLLVKHNKIKMMTSVVSILALALALVSAVQCAKIAKVYAVYKADEVASPVARNDGNELANDGEILPLLDASASKQSITPVYHLSRDGRNIVVIMMDRAESAYLPTIFKAFPQFRDNFAGFVYYPNTVSYNQGTLLGAPPLYGGYGYTPLEMNKRKNEKLVDKHTEALLMMPRILTEQASFKATVADLSWAGYKWIPDMSITDPYPLITGLNTERKYSSMWVKEHPESVRFGMTRDTIKRNMLYFSVFKAVPAFLRDIVYNDGAWWSSDEASTDVMEFIDYYSALDYLPRITAFDGEGDTFTMFANNTTHSGQELAPPDYVPQIKRVTYTGFLYPSISGNIAMYKLLGKWFGTLKEAGCYDNTRIIIVADHGIGKDLALYLAPYEGWKKKPPYCPDHNNPLLLVKDFGSSGAFTTDNKFMTNADVLQLALEGVDGKQKAVSNPVNPWNGKPIIFPAEEEKVARGVVLTHMWNPGGNIYTFNVPDGDWVTIRDSIFLKENWTRGTGTTNGG